MDAQGPKVDVDATIDLLTLTLLPGVGPRAIRELAGRGTLAQAAARPEEHEDLLPPGARHVLRSGAARRRAEAEIRSAGAKGFRIVGWDEPDYPPLLRRTYDPPPVLHVRGRLVGGEGERAVAVVGSRAASMEGRCLARAMARDLAAAGSAVVSGLARGIDAAAHEGALEARGRTVAVLGSGLDRLYPRENEALAARIVEAGGSVVSEFPLGVQPAPGHFPRRNRIIAGWGWGVVVVEAAARSGALSTARCALEEGREVLAVPGHPARPGSAGTNGLIRDGAVLARGAADVAQEMGLPLAPASEAAPPEDLLAVLRPDAPMGLEELAQRCGRPATDLMARLTELELAARIRRLPGAQFVRSY